ncbi:MAG TPA: hypothetical protein G4N92_04345 [Anaerolineae bacterium]|nr:hypothetical protein [Anaerolineae bacterium]
MSKKYYLSLVGIVLAGALLLTACNTGATADNASIIATSIEETLQATMETQAAEANATTAGSATATIDTTVSPTSAISGTPTTITLPTTDVSGDCLRVGLVDETIPDGTWVTPGQSFTKTWTIMNAGTCSWSTAYKLVFESGDQMNGPEYINLPMAVDSGRIVDISLDLKAYDYDGSYSGNWKLQTNEGVSFADLWVKIEVGTTPPQPYAVTSVVFVKETGLCLTGTTIYADITCQGAGTVFYYWVIDGVMQAQQHIYFDASSPTQTTAHTCVLPGGLYTIQIYIDIPNHQYFDIVANPCP